MKKLLIASLIASSSLMAVADETTLYGSLAYNVAATKNNADSVKSAWNKNRFSLEQDELNWGIKGEENMDNGLTAFWKLQFAGSGNSKDYAYVGLKHSDWGTVTLGTQDSLFKTVTNTPDIFQKAAFWGSTSRYDEQLDHPDNVISYVSPNLGNTGVYFGVAGILNGKNGKIVDTGLGLETGNNFTKSKSFGAGQVGLWYNNYGFYAGLAYQYVNSNFGLVNGVATNDTGALIYEDGYSKKNNVPFKGKGGTELIGLGLGYEGGTESGKYKIAFSEQHKAGDGDKMALAGEYGWGPHHVRAGVAYAKSDELNYAPKHALNDLNPTSTTYAPGVNDQKQAKTYCNNKTTKQYCSDNVYTYALGYQYDLSKRTYAYAEGLYTDWNIKKVPTAQDANGNITKSKKFDNGYQFNIGLRHDF